jgi:hypothetical protein
MRRSLRGWGLSLSYDDGECLEQLPLCYRVSSSLACLLLLPSVGVLLIRHQHSGLPAPPQSTHHAPPLGYNLALIAATSAESTPTPCDEAVNMGAMATEHRSRSEQ